MKRSRGRRGLRAIAGVSVALTTLGIVTSDAGAAAAVVQESGPLVRYPDPYGDGNATANPVLPGATARVHAVEDANGSTIVTLRVEGLAPNREFGSHVHVGACNVAKAGGHYQNAGSGSTYANPDNEVWLDFTTNPQGIGTARAKVDWTFRADEANAVVVHHRHSDHAGAAGPKLACLDVDF